jgi:hypothetical protein
MAALTQPNLELRLPQTVLSLEDPDPRISNTSDTARYLERLHEYVLESIKSLRQSQIMALDIDFAPLAKQLDDLGDLPEGWDGYDAPRPSAEAIREAHAVLRRMQEELVRPGWISASADGGVAFSFTAPNDRRAQIEVLNNGTKFAHLYDLSGNSHTEDWIGDLDERPFKLLLEPILHYIRP